MNRKIIFLLFIFHFVVLYTTFSQETNPSTGTSSRDLNKEEIIAQIQKEVYGTSAYEQSKVIVIPLVTEYSSVATLVAKNIFDELQTKSNFEQVDTYYNEGVEQVVEELDKIVNEVEKIEEKFNLMVLIYIDSEVKASVKRNNVYGITVEIVNYNQESVYMNSFEETLGNLFDKINQDKYKVDEIIDAVDTYKFDFSILKIIPKDSELPKYRIEIDKEQLTTVSTAGYAYFPTGEYKIQIYQMIDSDKEDESVAKEKLKVSFTTNKDTKEYIQEIDFSLVEKSKISQEILERNPFSVEALLGLEIGYVANATAVALNAPIEAQGRYTFQKLLQLPLYVGLMMRYNVVDGIDNSLYTASDVSFSGSTQTGTRTMLGFLPEAGYVFQFNHFLVMHVGLTGGILLYSSSFSDISQYSLPLVFGSMVPAFGVKVSFAEHILDDIAGDKLQISDRLYIIEQITVLYTDYQWVSNYILAIPAESSTTLIFKNESETTMIGILGSVTVGVGYRF